MKKSKNIKTIGSQRTTPVTQQEWDEVTKSDLEKERLAEDRVNTLWGPGTPFATQSEYQRSKLGSKYQ
jgi:hypothetical protein